MSKIWVSINNGDVFIYPNPARDNMEMEPNVRSSLIVFIANDSSAARQKGLSSCVHQKHAFRDNRVCSV